MRVVVQRVSRAQVSIAGKVHGAIQKGFVLLIGIELEDNQEDVQWMAQKILQMRIFSDEAGKMNLSIEEVNGSILAISQFTLHASTKKGNRPSFMRAARPEYAIPLYTAFLDLLENSSKTNVEKGVFGADMQIELVNDGPVTLLIDSKNKE